MPAPTLTNMQTAFVFAENTVNVFPALLDIDVTFTDTDFNMAGGSLSITGGELFEDRVWVRNQGTGAGQIGLNGDKITFGGVEFASIRTSGGDTFVTFNSAVTAAAIEALIENLTYRNLSNNPTPVRELVLNLRDAAGVALNAPEFQSFAVLTGADDPFVASGTSDPLQTGLHASPIMLDFDGDGDLDLGMASSNIFMPVYVAGPAGFSGPYQNGPLSNLAPPSEFAFYGAHLAIGPDLDSDYRAGDLVIGLGNGTLVGHGRAPSSGFGDNSIRFSTFAFLYDTDPFAWIDVGEDAAPTFADIDGDGDADLIVGARDGRIRLYDNNDGDHRFTERTGDANPFAAIDVGDNSAPVFINLDDDADLDLVVGSADGTLRSFRRNADGSWTELTGAANPFDGIDVGSRSTPHVTHLDGDGVLDLIVGSAAGRITALRNTTPQDGITLTITVTDEPDHTIEGTEGNDTLVGLVGSNTITGLGGNDLIRGHADPDALYGGDGFDIVDFRRSDTGVTVDLDDGRGAGGHAAGDEILGFEGIFGSRHDDRLLGSYFNDRIFGGAGDDVLAGRPGNDVLIGGAGADSIDGGAGLDLVSYRQSFAGVHLNLETLSADGGDATGDTIASIERVIGSDHADTLIGTNGANRLIGWGGDDRIEGGHGDDVISGGAGADSLSGGNGQDLLSYAGSSIGVSVDLVLQTATGGEATGDVIAGFEHVTGSSGADTLIGNGEGNRLFGGDGDDRIEGGDGADLVRGGAGADSLAGGRGIDTLDYRGSAAGVSVNLATGQASGGDAQGDVISGFESLIGSAHGDTLAGDARANRLIGGDGADSFVFRAPLGGGNVDRLIDYSVADGDRILLDNAVFTGLAEGILADAAFAYSLAGPDATTAEHRIIHDVLTNTLWFDADGVGGQDGVMFASHMETVGLFGSQFLVI